MKSGIKTGPWTARPGVGEWVWTLFLGALLIFTGWLAFSVSGLQLLGSRARIYSTASFLFLLVFFPIRIAALGSGHRAGYAGRGLLFFLAPLVLLPFAGSPNGGASIAGAKQRFTAAAVSSAPGGTPLKVIPLAPVAAVPAYSVSGDKTPADDGAMGDASGLPPLIFDKENFEDLCDEIGGAPGKNKGRKVSLEGFVLASESGLPHRFSLGRLLITCCPADGLYVGLEAQVEPGQSLPEKDLWFHLEGEVEPVQSDGVTTAVLKVIKAEPRPLPDDPYIYQH